uniref:Uncharacterized protein n=1 Tax=Zea mays TaxID=4577 RepID=C4IYA5_MAIZE|nr:unknown [Zea mays]
MRRARWQRRDVLLFRPRHDLLVIRGDGGHSLVHGEEIVPRGNSCLHLRRGRGRRRRRRLRSHRRIRRRRRQGRGQWRAVAQPLPTVVEMAVVLLFLLPLCLVLVLLPNGVAAEHGGISVAGRRRQWHANGAVDLRRRWREIRQRRRRR